MKRPFFRTFFITVSTTGVSPDGEFVVPSFGKTFYCLPNYNYLFVSFLIRFSMNNPTPYQDRVSGGLEWTRTTDLPLIRRVL